MLTDKVVKRLVDQLTWCYLVSLIPLSFGIRMTGRVAARKSTLVGFRGSESKYPKELIEVTMIAVFS